MLAKAVVPTLIGSQVPRIAPPVPVRSDIADFRAVSVGMGIDLMPWQETAARYLTATDADGYPLFREVCIVVARQNGKTHLAKPFIIRALRSGRRVMHIAQTRNLPRQMFGLIADSLEEDLFLRRRGKGGKMQTIWPRFGSGSEEILLKNEGSYRIAAANRGGARGFTNDIVIIDELREMETDEVVAAAESTTITSPWAQVVYLSNAGTDDSVVLNAVRDRAGKDPSLAYLEWSAAPERSSDDVEGWLEANPAVGHIPTTLASLDRLYRKHKLAGTLAQFETENLCRWVSSLREPLVASAAWGLCEVESLPTPRRSYLGISIDPDGKRASAVQGWQDANGTVSMRVVADIVDPDLTKVGRDFLALARRLRVTTVGFDPMTDAEVAKYFPKTESITGGKFASASTLFVNLVESGKIRWTDAAAITDDLTWASRKEHEESGKFQAVRANDAHPITAVLAAIRSASLANGRPTVTPRIY